MPDKQMTPERAIIILDQLNTDGRIEVDRDELRAAIRTARAALRKQIPIKPIKSKRIGDFDRLFLQVQNYLCPECRIQLRSHELCCNRCSCGQALDLTD